LSRPAGQKNNAAHARRQGRFVSHQTYGAVRVNDELREEHQIRVGRKRVARLMRQRGIKGIPGQGRTRRTTIPDAKQPPAPDLVERRFVADRPNALWLADITFVPTLEGWHQCRRAAGRRESGVTPFALITGAPRARTRVHAPAYGVEVES
jgi:transposase InsO family protein